MSKFKGQSGVLLDQEHGGSAHFLLISANVANR